MDTRLPPPAPSAPVPGFEIRPGMAWGVGLAATAVIGWRLAAVPVGRLWRDWVLLLALEAIVTVAAARRKSWPVVSAGIMAYLLGIYVQGQWPHIVAIFRAMP
jgi:hypothetical protein